MMRQIWSALALSVCALALQACDDAVVGTCADPCATREPACATCPAVADEVCVEGACVDVATRDALVTADVSINRDLDGVVAVIAGIVDARATSCADVLPLKDAPDVLAGNRVDVSGGPFHPGLTFGEVPAGPVLVVADGLNANDALVGRGCVAIDVVTGDNAVGVVAVDP